MGWRDKHTQQPGGWGECTHTVLLHSACVWKESFWGRTRCQLQDPLGYISQTGFNFTARGSRHSFGKSHTRQSFSKKPKDRKELRVSPGEFSQLEELLDVLEPDVGDAAYTRAALLDPSWWLYLHQMMSGRRLKRLGGCNILSSLITECYKNPSQCIFFCSALDT